MLSADCQKSGGKGKALGLHSAVFSEFGDGSTRLNSENDGKITENCSQLRKFGQQDVKEVWFAGVHSDVGGSYPEPESQLSKIASRESLDSNFKGFEHDSQVAKASTAEFSLATRFAYR